MPIPQPDRLTVLVPARNEAPTIGTLLDRLRRVEFGAVEREVIVIDDGSTDDTAVQVTRFAEDWPDLPVQLLRQVNRGKGAAVRAGLTRARGRWVAVQDADLEYHPADLPRLLAAARQPGRPVVYGTRNRFGRHPGSSPVFYWGGRLLTLWANLLFGSRLTDYATGYKLLERDLLLSLGLRRDDFAFCAEVTAELLRRRVPIFEVPIRYHPRGVDEGKKIRPRDGLAAALVFLRVRLRGRGAAPPAAGQRDGHPSITRRDGV